MPIFEFACSACGHSFDELCQADETGAGLECPECGHRGAKKLLSTFHALGLRELKQNDACGDCPLTDCSGCPSHAGS